MIKSRKHLNGEIEFSTYGLFGSGYLLRHGVFMFNEWTYDSTCGRTVEQLKTEVSNYFEGKTTMRKSIQEVQETHPNAWIKHEGHVYRIIQKGNSKSTRFGVDTGHVALFNVKSRTIRAIHWTTEVEYFTNESKEPTLNEQHNPRLTALEVEASKDEETWNQIRNAERVLSGILEEDQVSVLVGPLNNLAEKVMEERGFRCLGIVDFVPNDKFYPPIVIKHTATELSWDRHK